MPQMGYDMEEGSLVRWLKAEGDEVQRGEPVAEIETDKAVVEMEATGSGTLRKTLLAEGSTARVGSIIAIIGTADEDISQYLEQTTPPSQAKPVAAAPSQPEAPVETTAQEAPSVPEAAPPAGEVKASPVARRIAREKGVDLGQVTGTGPGGRIVREDVEKHAEAAPAAVPEAEQPSPAAGPPTPAEASAPASRIPEEPGRFPLSRMRQAIARATSQSKNGTPHFYVTIEADMTEAMALRSQLNHVVEEAHGTRLTVNDLVLRAVVLALKQYPNLNASYREGYVEVHSHINLGVAIGKEEGLIVPAIINAQDKSLVELALAIRDVADRAEKGRLHQDEYNGTFSTSNLGMYGVDEFSAIILPPQAGVLAISAVQKKPVAVDDEVVLRSMMKLTVSVDHRVSDGVEAARFMHTLKSILEQPLQLLM